MCKRWIMFDLSVVSRLSYLIIFVLCICVTNFSKFSYTAGDSNTCSILIEAIPKMLNWFKRFTKVDKHGILAFRYLLLLSFMWLQEFLNVTTIPYLKYSCLIFVQIKPAIIFHSFRSSKQGIIPMSSPLILMCAKSFIYFKENFRIIISVSILVEYLKL